MLTNVEVDKSQPTTPLLDLESRRAILYDEAAAAAAARSSPDRR